MVNFNAWRCRNCKHYHTTISGQLRPGDQCSNPNVKETYESYGCKCMKWESNDNLVYLENKYNGR